jgi:hypothetical protein
MSQSKRALPILAVSALALGLIVVPAAQSSAVTSATTTYTVQLTTLAHKALTTLDATESIQLSETDSAGTYAAYAQAAPVTGSSAQYAGKITKGKVIFTSVPENATFTLYVFGNRGYSSVYKQVTTTTAAATLSIALSKYGSISGKVTGPGGKAVSGAQVDAIGKYGYSSSAATTDSAGKYTLQGLTTGSYRVQFNAHSSGDTTTTSKYTWSYWKGTATASKSKKLAVTAQTTKKSATSTKGINGTVKAGHELTVKLGMAGASTAANGYSIAVTDGITYENYNEYQPTAQADPQFSLGLNKGKYKIQVTIYTSGNSTTYWYAGAGKAATTDSKKAVALSFAGSKDETVTLTSAG